MDTLLTVGIIIAAIVVIIVLAFIGMAPGLVLQGKREHFPAHRYAPP